MANVSIEKATVNVLLELNGEVHLVAMSRDRYGAVSLLVKTATEKIIKTGKTQGN